MGLVLYHIVLRFSVDPVHIERPGVLALLSIYTLLYCTPDVTKIIIITCHGHLGPMYVTDRQTSDSIIA